jgi:hypothetical protein
MLALRRGEPAPPAATGKSPGPSDAELAEEATAMPRTTNKVARWFDVKEHWVAIGLLASLALVLVLAFWDPQRDGPALSPVVVGLSLVIAGTVWLAAIVGVLTSAWRAV